MMGKLKKHEPGWLPDPEDNDYPAAASYLALHFDTATVEKLISALKRAPITVFKAKDIFRASGLSLLGVSNSHVAGNLKKVKKGTALAPLLLVRRHEGESIIVADGYHRMCAMYVLNEDLDVPCKIV